MERGDKDYVSSAEKHANIVEKCATLFVGLTEDKASGVEMDLYSILSYYYFVSEKACAELIFLPVLNARSKADCRRA